MCVCVSGVHLEVCGATYSNIEFGAHGNPERIMWHDSPLVHKPIMISSICDGITYQHICLLYYSSSLLMLGLGLLNTYSWID